MECGRMAGQESEDIGDTEDKVMVGRGNGQDLDKMIGVDDNRRAEGEEEDRAEAGVAIGEVVDILPMGVPLVLEGDPEVDNTFFSKML